MSPRVTVLLAVRNGGPYLSEAVASVLAQTYADFELLIVDDASTDGAVDALGKDARIRVLRNERNLGQIPSLNLGLQEARGEYVARLDHDDVCLPRRLEKQVELLDGAAEEIALAATWADVVDERGALWAHNRPRIDSFVEFASRVTVGQTDLFHPTLMFRRASVLELGSFDERLGAAEDQDLYRQLVLLRREVRVVPETLLRYRRHESQMTVAHSDMVRRHDSLGHERFLLELAPASPARTLRLLFTGDREFWAEPQLESGLLDEFLESASDRLALDRGERAHFARALTRSAASSLIAGWTAGRYDGRARPVAAFVASRGARDSAFLARLHPLLRASAPAGKPFAAARRTLRQALRSEALRGIRASARRSRALRALYTRVVDARPSDD
jgi:hypothetical protein